MSSSYNMKTQKYDFFLNSSKLNFDLCWRAKNIQVGLNMHLYDNIGDASTSLRGSISSCRRDHQNTKFRERHNYELV